MIALLLSIFVAAQGIPPLPGTGGTISGTLKFADGTPAVGARVAAAVRPDSLADFDGQGALMSITQADENGRFTLENVPQGRYLITAGKVDLPTYFPGTTDISQAKTVLITAGATMPGIDFAISDPSIRTNTPFDLVGLLGQSNPTRFVTVDIKIEDGAKLPVFANGKFPVVRLTRKSDLSHLEMTFGHSSLDVPVPLTGISEYRVTVENLPDGYVVKSLRSDTVDLTKDTFKLQPAPIQLSGPVSPAFAAGVAAALGGTTVSTTAPPTPQSSSIYVTLARVPATTPIPPGARVSGQSTAIGVRSIFISDKPGTFYSDGSFEFRGVPAGRHTIILINPESGSGALNGISLVTAGRNVIVGEEDIDQVTLGTINMLPLDAESLMATRPANNHPPGAIPLATIRGRVVDESTKQAMPGGTITINGQSRSTFPINADGRFEIPRLFPGMYKLEVGLFGYETIRQTIEVDDDDISLELAAVKL